MPLARRTEWSGTVAAAFLFSVPAHTRSFPPKAENLLLCRGRKPYAFSLGFSSLRFGPSGLRLVAVPGPLSRLSVRSTGVLAGVAASAEARAFHCPTTSRSLRRAWLRSEAIPCFGEYRAYRRSREVLSPGLLSLPSPPCPARRPQLCRATVLSLSVIVRIIVEQFGCFVQSRMTAVLFRENHVRGVDPPVDTDLRVTLIQ